MGDSGWVLCVEYVPSKAAQKGEGNETSRKLLDAMNAISGMDWKGETGTFGVKDPLYSASWSARSQDIALKAEKAIRDLGLKLKKIDCYHAPSRHSGAVHEAHVVRMSLARQRSEENLEKRNRRKKA
jgi:hypothetical protein